MKNKTDWPSLLEAFEGCGLTHAQFCSMHKVSLAAFRQRYYRWRKDYGGMKTAQVKRLKDLERENGGLKKAVAELALDKQILKEALEGNY